MPTTTRQPTTESPGLAGTAADGGRTSTTLTRTGVALDLPERRVSPVRVALVVVLALLGATLALAAVWALAGTPIGGILLVAGVLVAPFVVVALVVDGVATAAEHTAAASAAAARHA